MDSSQNENEILINDENEMCFNECNIQEILNGIFQTQQKKIEEITEPNKRNEMETKPLKITCSKKNIEKSLQNCNL
jgi:hypothetical protein